MLRPLLSLFPVDRRDADRAADVIATTPLLAAACWTATLVTGLAVIVALAQSVDL